MANRNELHIDQSGDVMGVTFTVYRSGTPDVTEESTLLAVVEEANVTHTAYKQVGEVLKQDTLDPFTWYTSKVYEQEPEFRLYVNGSRINPADITSYPNSKKFTLNDKYDMTTNTVTADYWYLASVVVDDLKPQPGVTYNGPLANSLHAPLDFKMAYDSASYKMRVEWGLDTTPVPYFYALKAKDRSGYESALSAAQGISLSCDPATMSYVVEKAIRVEGPWFIGAEVQDLFWEDPDAAVGGHIALEMSGSKKAYGVASLTLQNPWYQWEQNWRSSYFYRVRCKDDEGETGPSAPELPYYKGINIKPAKYVLRRRLDNGAPATLDGLDAITIKTWTEDEAGSLETLTYEDSALQPLVYGYTTYVIDEKGMVGQPFYTKVDMR